MRRKGVSRILEAIFASIMIISASYVAYFLILPPNISIYSSRQELSRLGYSMLDSLASNYGFDQMLFDEEGNLRSGWENDFKIVLSTLLPPNIIFNASVYNATIEESTGFVVLQKLNSVPITNVANQDAFIKAGDNVQIVYIYTTYNRKNGDLEVFYIYLTLGVLVSV